MRASRHKFKHPHSLLNKTIEDKVKQNRLKLDNKKEFKQNFNLNK